MNEKTYLLRKYILEAMAFYGSDIACSLDDISCHHKVLLLRVSSDAIREQMNQLANFGYLERQPGFDGRYFKVTQKGLMQINPEFTPDPFISGRPS